MVGAPVQDGLGRDPAAHAAGCGRAPSPAGGALPGVDAAKRVRGHAARRRRPVRGRSGRLLLGGAEVWELLLDDTLHGLVESVEEVHAVFRVLLIYIEDALASIFADQLIVVEQQLVKKGEEVGHDRLEEVSGPVVDGHLDAVEHGNVLAVDLEFQRIDYHIPDGERLAFGNDDRQAPDGGCGEI